MADSWRNILERAAGNLSIELDRDQTPALTPQPANWPAQRRPTPRPVLPRTSRDMLAKELEAISRPREGRASPNHVRERAVHNPVVVYEAPAAPAIRQPVQPPRQRPAQKSRAARELAAISISVAIVVLAVYGFFFLLK